MVSTNPTIPQHMVGRIHRARMDFKAKTKGVFARKPPRTRVGLSTVVVRLDHV